MRSILAIGGFVALGVIAASIIFGFSLGIIFSAVMVLFASVALLFWYVLRIVMSLSSDDD